MEEVRENVTALLDEIRGNITALSETVKSLDEKVTWAHGHVRKTALPSLSSRLDILEKRATRVPLGVAGKPPPSLPPEPNAAPPPAALPVVLPSDPPDETIPMPPQVPARSPAMVVVEHAHQLAPPHFLPCLHMASRQPTRREISAPVLRQHMPRPDGMLHQTNIPPNPPLDTNNLPFATHSYVVVSLSTEAIMMIWVAPVTTVMMILVATVTIPSDSVSMATTQMPLEMFQLWERQLCPLDTVTGPCMPARWVLVVST